MRGRRRGLKTEGEGLINILPLNRGGLLECGGGGGLNRGFTVFYCRRLNLLMIIGSCYPSDKNLSSG